MLIPRREQDAPNPSWIQPSDQTGDEYADTLASQYHKHIACRIDRFFFPGNGLEPGSKWSSHISADNAEPSALPRSSEHLQCPNPSNSSDTPYPSSSSAGTAPHKCRD